MKILKISSKYQTTIPQEVRVELNLKVGDMVFFEINRGVVTLKKMDKKNKEYLKSLSETLTEWNSEEDEEAYRDLQSL